MASDSFQPQIDRYVDGELSREEMRAMDSHLRECSSCAAEALYKTQMKLATRLGGRRYQPSPEFRRKIAGQSVGKPRRSGWAWTPLAAVIATALIIVAGIGINRSIEQARSRQLLSELTDLHVANLAASTPVDIVSSDRHTVKPWFQGKLPFSFNLPELAGSPFILLGGRLTYLDHEPGAHLIYNAGAHHISVFIFRDQPEMDRAFAKESSNDALSFHVDSWTAQGLRYFVVGDASEESIRALAGLLQKAEAQ